MPGQVVSALPNAMRQKLESMEAQATEPQTTEAPPTETAPQGTEATATPTATPTPEGERITLSRDEYNELQAAAGKVKTAEGRASAVADRVKELEARLTELAQSNKATATETPQTVVEQPTIQFTEDELKDFGDSKEFISKVARSEINAALQEINLRLKALEGEVKGVATTAAEAGQNTFLAQLRGKVPDLDSIIAHKNWADFLDAVDPMTGLTYEQLLQAAVQNKRLDPAANIYGAFKTKYMGATPASSGAYAGVNPTGAVSTPIEKPVQGKLKVSDRKKASEDYRKGKITWDKLQEVNKAFDEADAKGNVDYSN